MSDQIFWAVRIHQTTAHTLYVRADTIGAAYEAAHDRWYRGDDGDEMEQESIGYEIESAEPAPDRTEVSNPWLNNEGTA